MLHDTFPQCGVVLMFHCLYCCNSLLYHQLLESNGDGASSTMVTSQAAWSIISIVKYLLGCNNKR